MALTIYHNPRCSKSRKTLEIIRDAGVEPRIVHYLDDPPDGARIAALASLMGVPVKSLMRSKESVVAAAADLPDLDDDAALAGWIASHPAALERPIVVSEDGRQAVVGRPPENVEALLR